MTLSWKRPVTLVNGRIVTADGEADSLRFGTDIIAIGERPHAGDGVIDVDGAFVLPGLINAHEHLELNHYGALPTGGPYRNASEWIDAMRPRLRADGAIRANSRFPLADRLFIGGLKNLLAGVTLVAHHNPPYPGLARVVPVRVLQPYAWAHSFALEGHPVGAGGEPGPRVAQTCHRAGENVPFFVHAAEGIDRAAEAEIDRLDAAGCLRATTVLVHGVAMTDVGWRRASSTGTSLVWCPQSNRALFGATIPVRAFLDTPGDAWRRLCLGTDSRLTGARDLLEELRVAQAMTAVTAEELLRMVTSSAADVLRTRRSGRLERGAPADLTMIPASAADAASSLVSTRRSEVRAVIVGGTPMVADPRVGSLFPARRTAASPIRVDGIEKLANTALVRRMARCPIAEPGVTCGS